MDIKVDEKTLQKIKKMRDKKERYLTERAEVHRKEKLDKIRCMVDGCIKKTKTEFRGGWYCTTHGDQIKRRYGRANGLCFRCGDGKLDNGKKQCEKCLERMRYNKAKWYRGETSNRTPIAVMLIKRYGVEILA